MQTIGTRAARNHFARLIRQTAEGAEFLVCRHGRPIATIKPYEPHNEPKEPTPDTAAPGVQECTTKT